MQAFAGILENKIRGMSTEMVVSEEEIGNAENPK